MIQSFVFIRHAQSMANQKKKMIRNAFSKVNINFKETQDYKQKLKHNIQLLDVNLSIKGFNQAMSLKNSLILQQIEIVIVSPLRRALQTCDILFGDQKHIKVFVQPLLSERLDSVASIGGKLVESKQKYGHKFDFSRIPEHIQQSWFLEFVLPQQKKIKAKNLIQKENLKPYHATSKLFKQHGPQTHSQLNKRIRKLKEYLLHYNSQKRNGKVVIIGHKKIMKSLIATNFNEDGSPIDGLGLQNCQMVEKQIFLH